MISQRKHAGFLMLDQNLFIFRIKTHVVGMIEIITVIVTHTYNTSTAVVKASKWKLIYMISMKNKCAWHLFCEVRQRVSIVMPFLKLLYPYRESLCLKLLPQFSSHVNETCCTCILWRVYERHMFCEALLVPELCPFF